MKDVSWLFVHLSCPRAFRFEASITWVLFFQEQTAVYRFGVYHWQSPLGSGSRRKPVHHATTPPQELRQLLQLKDTALQMLQEEVLQLQELGKPHQKWRSHGKIIVQRHPKEEGFIRFRLQPYLVRSCIHLERS